jgi:hypothetical protein
LESTILRLDRSDEAASLEASSRSCAEERCFSFRSSRPGVGGGASDVVFERGTQLGFLFVRSGIIARRRLLEDLYSFR